MRRPQGPRAAIALSALLSLGACADPSPADLGQVPVDSALVLVLADVHLADARASLGDPPDREARAESLRAVALAAHGMPPAELERVRDRLASDPALGVATYDAVASHLARIDLPPSP